MQRDRLNRLLERTPDSAFALTTRAEIWAWNPPAEAITGFRAKAVVGQSFPETIQARGPLGRLVDADYCARAVRDGGVPSFDLELTTATGDELWLNVSVLLFDQTRVSPALLVHLAHDITAVRQRRELYERLRETAQEIVRLPDEEHNLVPVPHLTHQEQRSLALFAEGRTPTQVAKELGISSQTLRNHLYHVNQKLGTHNRLQAVIHAARRGLI